MRILVTLVCATAALCGIDNVHAQGFLDQLEGVLDAEAKAADARRAAPSATPIPEATSKPTPGYLGLIADEDSGGVQIEWVREGTAAHRAGVQVGDVILRVGERDVATLDAMGDALAGRVAGERIVLFIKRGDRELEIPVTLGARPNPSEASKPQAAGAAPPANVRIDALDALVELERLLDEESPPDALPAKPAKDASDAARTRRIAEFESELDNIQRRIAELEREIAELADE